MKKIREYVVLASLLAPKKGVSVLLFVLRLLFIVTKKKLFGASPMSLSISYRGIQKTIFIRDNADIAVLQEVFVEEEYALTLPFTPKRIVDIGGHIGMTALYFRSQFPEAHIVVYEADPKNYALLVKNTAHDTRMRCIHGAVTSVSGTVAFFTHDSSISSSLIERKGSTRISVPAYALDTLLDTSTDLIKYDIEGAEFELFSHTKDLSRCPAYVGEVHYDIFKQPKEVYLALFNEYDVTERPLSTHRSLLLSTRRLSSHH